MMSAGVADETPTLSVVGESCLPKCDHHRLRSREVLGEFAQGNSRGFRSGVFA